MSRHDLPEPTLQRPAQAVILAGGRGTRLRPITDTRPKPMVEFHGRPFLEYLIEMLRDQGLERILLLLGYLPDVIRDHFGNGSRWGVRIEYGVSPADDETGRRIQRARPRLDPVFMLLYCDNYWPMRFDAMWRQFCSANARANSAGARRAPLARALVTVYDNADHYSRDNVRVDEEGYVSVYDKTRTRSGLRGVEIGFLILERSVVDLVPRENVSFEEAVYPRLVARRQLQAHVTGHRYYSVGSHRRLPLTEEFLKRRPAVILDRDGVLNRKASRARYVRTWDEWEWLPGAREALSILAEAGYRVVLVTNQAGIARGAMTENDLADIHEHMKADAAEAGGRIDAIYHCPHGWDEGCECRKPRPGMLFQAQRGLNLDLSRTWFIGDDERDAQAADAAGCPFQRVSPTRSLLDIVRELLGETMAVSAAREDYAWQNAY